MYLKPINKKVEKTVGYQAFWKKDGFRCSMKVSESGVTVSIHAYADPKESIL